MTGDQRVSGPPCDKGVPITKIYLWCTGGMRRHRSDTSEVWYDAYTYNVPPAMCW